MKHQRGRFAVGLVAVTLVACGGSRPPPAQPPGGDPEVARAAAIAPVLTPVVRGEPAACAGGQTCQYTCPAGGCDIACAGGSTCHAECPGGGCHLVCAAGAVCDFACAGEACQVVCATGATCEPDE